MLGIRLEHREDNITRVLLIEVDENTEMASIFDIVEADEANLDALVEYLQEGYPDLAAVIVDSDYHEEKQSIGNHHYVTSDTLGVFELAQAVYPRKVLGK